MVHHGIKTSLAVTLKEDEKIVFLGDSITYGGAGSSGFITLMRQVFQRKGMGVELLGAGIGGNKVRDLQMRVEKDVIARNPTLVFIYIGINDVWHREEDPSKGTTPEKFEEGLKDVSTKITTAGARIVLCTPSVIGEKHDGTNPLDKKLDEYADICGKVAKELNLPVCDLRKAFLAHLKENNPMNKHQDVLTFDGVHLNAAGNCLVVEQMLNMFSNIPEKL